MDLCGFFCLRCDVVSIGVFQPKILLKCISAVFSHWCLFCSKIVDKRDYRACEIDLGGR